MSALDRFPRSWILGVVGLAGVLAAVGVAAGVRAATHRVHPEASARDARPFVELHAPHVAAPIVVDAAIEGQKAWESDIGSTKVFKDENGQGMVPYTEAKVRWADGTLYLWLYAGDLDLEANVKTSDGPVLQDDAFAIEFGVGDKIRTIDVSVLGTVADAECTGTAGGPLEGRRCDPSWTSHATVSVDADGTLNKTGDNDEEWVVEMAVPFASLGLQNATAGTRIPFAIRRCDIGKTGKHACGGFGEGKTRGELVLDGALLAEAQASARP
jgi:hypothetical protein